MCKIFETLFSAKQQTADLKVIQDAQEVLNGRLDNLEVDIQSQIACQVGEMFNQEREAFKLDCEKMVDQIVKSLMEIHQFDTEKKQTNCNCQCQEKKDLKEDLKKDDFKKEYIDDETINGPAAECEVVEPLTFEERTRIAAKDAYARAHSPKFLGYINKPSDLDEIPWTYYEQIRQGDFVRVCTDMWVAWTEGDDGEIGDNYECQLFAGDILVASNAFECDCATQIEDSYYQYWSILRPVYNRKSF